MSLHIAAQHLAAKGRGPDTTLVHMAPSEVAGLQSLAKAAGGSLTVNPDTGLPEAGFLSNLLPTIIGAGITAATGGAAAPWMVGAGIGGLQALRTGSLTKGLSAGLGAYGGAGLTGGLMGLGTGALSQQAGTAAAQGLEGLAADQAAEQAIKERLANASVMDKLRAGAGTFEWNKPMEFVSGLGGGDKKKGALMLGAAALPTVMEAVTPQQAPGIGGQNQAMPRRLRYDINSRAYVPISQEEAFGMRGFAAGGMPEWNQAWTPDVPGYGDQGRDFGREILYYNPAAVAEEEKADAKPVVIKPVVDDSPRGNDGIGGQMGNPADADWGLSYDIGQKLADLGLTKAGEYMKDAAVRGAMDARGTVGLGNVAGGSLISGIQAADKQGSNGIGNIGGGALNSGIQAADKAGNNAAPAGGSGAVDGGLAGLGGSLGGAGSSSDPALNAKGGMIGHYASGGLGTLGGYSDGGRLLRGPGDGVSDSIPATIGHKRMPARLANNEFVIPARIVSELGNGSTEAGARALYKMMDRVQAARKKSIGKGKVAVDSQATKYLPA